MCFHTNYHSTWVNEIASNSFIKQVIYGKKRHSLIVKYKCHSIPMDPILFNEISLCKVNHSHPHYWDVHKQKKCGSTLHRNYHTRVLSLFILSSLTEIALEVCHISGLIVVSVLACSYLPLLGELSGGLVIEEKEGF